MTSPVLWVTCISLWLYVPDSDLD